ncbi:MAG: hypothetical protein AB3K77_07465 [Methanosarcinaceae archaeon]
MLDPCWLPSAIMQTIGALYAIFIAVFALLAQMLYSKEDSISNNKSKEYFTNFVNSFMTLFKLLTILVFVTEAINGLFLLGLISGYIQWDSTYIFTNRGLVPCHLCLFISFASFLITVLYICGFSYKMLESFANILKQSYDFDSQIKFSEILEQTIFMRGQYISILIIIAMLTVIISIHLIYNNLMLLIFSLIILIPYVIFTNERSRKCSTKLLHIKKVIISSDPFTQKVLYLLLLIIMVAGTLLFY